jgi:hypothetical protein
MNYKRCNLPIMNDRKSIVIRTILIILFCIVISTPGYNQERKGSSQDSVKITAGAPSSVGSTKKNTVVQEGKNKSIEITGGGGVPAATQDGKVNMRVVGSVIFISTSGNNQEKTVKQKKSMVAEGAPSSINLNKTDSVASSANLSEVDTTKAEAILSKMDTVKQVRENSPLDMTQNRGLAISTDDGKLKMHILGSIRFSALYDSRYLADKNSFNTYDILPGDINKLVPNYYNGLGFSRMGFEVTRKTKKGDFFIRLETDFAGVDNAYRIRHAYGQFGNWLVGQTWSLLTNVTSLPAKVDHGGPVGAISIRTPQVRYNFTILKKIKGAAALEYSLADFAPVDSIKLTTLQTVPNITARLGISEKLGSFQLATIIAPITGIDESENRNTFFGFGASLSGTFNLNNNDHVLFQATTGKSIAHFMNPFKSEGQDMTYDPIAKDFSSLNVNAGFVAYEHIWPKNISSNLSFGIAAITNQNFQQGSDFNYSYSVSADAFMELLEGLKIGLEYSFGQRFNVDYSRGVASRIWALFYYDF